jgi:hypothetical protein
VPHCQTEALLWNDHTTVAHRPITQLLHRLRDALLRHRELLHNRLNLVEGSEIQHLLVHIAGSDDTTLYSEVPEDEVT